MQMPLGLTLSPLEETFWRSLEELGGDSSYRCISPVYKKSPHVFNNNHFTPLNTTKYSKCYLGKLSGALHHYMMLTVII